MLINRYIIVVVGKENRFYNKVDVGRLNPTKKIVRNSKLSYMLL
jgi:hypothetical protein